MVSQFVKFKKCLLICYRITDIISAVPTLWIGTSFGSILTLVVSMPEREVRKSQPVLITINGMK